MTLFFTDEVIFGRILLPLLLRTTLLALFGLAVWGTLTAFRCRDRRTTQLAWTLALLAGLIGGTLPILPTGLSLDGFVREEMGTGTGTEKGQEKRENRAPGGERSSGTGGNSNAASVETPNDSLAQSAPLAQEGVSEENGGRDGAGRDALGGGGNPDSSSAELPPHRLGLSSLADAGSFFLLGRIFAAVYLLVLAALAVIGLVSSVRGRRDLAHSSPAEGTFLAEWQSVLESLPTGNASRQRNVQHDSRRDSRHNFRRAPELRLTEKTGPALWAPLGFHPVVAVPRDFWEDASPEVRVGILRHEAAHWLHHDFAKSLFAKIVLALHWFNPVAHLAVRRVEEAAESACDALAFGSEPDGVKRFAASMLTLYESTPRFAYFQNRFGRSDFYRRLEQLKNSKSQQKDSIMKKTLLTLMAVTALLAITSLNFADSGGKKMESGKLKIENRVPGGQQSSGVGGDSAAVTAEAAKVTAPGTYSVTGRLRGEGGAILADTPISFVSWRPVEGKPIAFDDPESVTRGQTRTDVDGRFAIQPFSNGRCVVTAEPTDFAITTFSVEDGANDLGDLTVERGVRPEFTLLERDGSPVKQGAVMLMPLDKTPGGWYSFLCRRIGFADDKGKVVCPPVKPGEYIAGILPPKPMGEMRETWIIKITPENKPLTWTAPETISITLRGLPSGDYFSTNGVWKILSSMRTDEEGRLREFSIRNFEVVDLGDGARRLDGIPVGSETLALGFGQMFDDYTIRLRVEGENEWREVKGNGEIFLPSLSQDSTVELECKPIDKAAVAAEKERKIKETRALAWKVKNDPNVTITKIGKTAGEFDSALTKSTRPEETAVRLFQAYINSRDVNEIFDRIARLETVKGKTLLVTDKERQMLNMLWKGGGFDMIRERTKKTMIDTVCQRGENALVICRTFDDGFWQGFPVTRDTKSGEWLLSGPPQSALSLEEALALFAEK